MILLCMGPCLASPLVDNREISICEMSKNFFLTFPLFFHDIDSTQMHYGKEQKNQSGNGISPRKRILYFFLIVIFPEKYRNKTKQHHSTLHNGYGGIVDHNSDKIPCYYQNII